MPYIEQYRKLKESFDINLDKVPIPDSDLMIRNFEFISAVPDTGVMTTNDDLIEENICFRYPVLLHKNGTKPDRVIILLHGLNERTWHKHLTSARLLAEKSSRPVIMFPLSFHINRGLPEWTDIRKMADPLERRKHAFAGIRDASIINCALSERLTECPQRFFLSGFQSTMDLLSLIQEIQSGNHPLFAKNTKADLFAYSISCMLLQSLMISNPDVLKHSRIVLFAGGSLFSYMNGLSKYIMDSVAFGVIHKYYVEILDKKEYMHKDIRQLIMEHRFGKAFRSLITFDGFRKKREQSLFDFNENLMVIALRDDKIMPVEGIRQAVGERFFRSGRFNILHFNYEYSHENPFPVLYEKLEKQVDKAFLSVFNPALRFFCNV